MSRSSIERANRRGGMSFLASKIDEKQRMKESISQHVTGLPPNILHMFQARPSPAYLRPPRRKQPIMNLIGVSNYIHHFSEAGTAEHQPPQPSPGHQDVSTIFTPPEPRLFLNPELAHQVSTNLPTKLERFVHSKKEKIARNAEELKHAIACYNPQQDPAIEGDPLKTLFVGRLPYDITERQLRREFEEFGPIKRIQIVYNKQTGKAQGYAFLEYEHKSDMKEAYKATDGMKIGDRKCIVDVERGRTVPGWKPMRLGGGKGGIQRATMQQPKDMTMRRFKRLVDRYVGESQKETEVEAEALITGEADRHHDHVEDRNEMVRDRRRDYRADDHHHNRRRSRSRSRSRSRDRRRRDTREYRDDHRRREMRRSGQRDGGSRRDSRDDYYYYDHHVGGDRGEGGHDRGRDDQYYRVRRDDELFHRDRDDGDNKRNNSRKRDREVEWDAGDDYRAVPPPGYVGNDAGDDEPEEGEYVDGGPTSIEAFPAAKRLKDHEEEEEEEEGVVVV